jgi:hypothetical protein
MAGCGGISFSDFSSAVASSFETPRKSAAPQDEVNQILMVRSAATPRVSNHLAVMRS